MALPKLFQRIFWHNNTTPAIQEDNLNAMSKGLSDVDDRVIGLAGTIMEDVPQIQEDIEELEADMALIDTKIASATAEANRATTAANNAAASVISAGNKALVSEGWAKGTQNGAAVGSSSPYYHNNAEYFKNQARSFTPQGYQDLVDDVDSLKETFTNFEESITGEVVDSKPYVLRQGLGNLADMNLVGGSVAWNQLVVNGNFASTSGWNAVNSTFTVSNNVARVTATTRWGRIQTNNNVNYKANHVYFGTATITGTTEIYFDLSSGMGSKYCTSSSREKIEILAKKSSDVSGNPAVGDKRTSGWTEIKVENFMIFDLTQMFGSTIADYIYSLEQATAGAGVAWFRKYFPNAYYGYQSGKIESVNVASRKVVGKNLLNVQLPSETKNGVTLKNNGDGTYTLTGTSSTSLGSFESTQTIELDVGTYIWRASLDGSSDIGGESTGYSYVNGLNGTTNWYRSYGGERHYKLIVTEKSTIKLGFSWYNATSALDITFYPMIRLATVEDATYEPYQEWTADFDSSKQLRGIPKLVDNKLSYDGDIYTADGTVTRKYGIVDLGTLDWEWNAGGSKFVHTGNIGAKSKTGSTIVCSKYAVVDNIAYVSDTMPDKSICMSYITANRIYVYDTSAGTDPVAFKTAMSGVYLVYELATPTTESATAYQNPQRAFTNGTEEFVDYGVQSAIRDVSIPVGNDTTYQLNETLPPTEDYVDGALKFKAAISALGTDESVRTTASRAYTTGEFFYKDGKMYKVLTSIAQGATFTINTNCQQTTLFAELKALAQ